MGDADIPRVMMPVQELEEIMEDALNEVDVEMSRLFAFMTFLNDRTTNIMGEVVRWRKFRSCFTALNLLVVPIVFAIFVAFVTVEFVEMNSYSQDCLQAFIMFLVYLSGFIGLPMYICTLLQAYLTTDVMEVISVKREHSGNSLVQNETDSDVTANRTPTLADLQESFDTISEFRRLAGRRIGGSRLAEPEGIRIDQAEEAALDSSQGFELPNNEIWEMAEARSVNTVAGAKKQFVDLDPHTVLRKEERIPEKEENIYGVQIIVNSDRNFSVEIKEEEGTSESVENDKPVTDESEILQPVGVSAVRDRLVEKIGEGDSNILQKETVSKDLKDNQAEQILLEL